MHLQLCTSLSIAALTVLLGTNGCGPKGNESVPAFRESGNPDPAAEIEPAVKEPVSAGSLFGLSPGVKSVVSEISGEFSITYEWTLTKKRNQDWRIFVHFTDSAGKILFQNDHQAEPVTSQWEPGKVQQGPFNVKIPADAGGPFEIRMGLFQSSDDAPGASGRAALDGIDDGEKRYLVGHLTITDRKAAFIPEE